MSDPLKCAECHVELTVADAEDAVPTDAGPVHRECFDGPVPPPAKADDFLDEFEPLAEETMTPEEIEAEEESRREYGDVPLSALLTSIDPDAPFWNNTDNVVDGPPDREALTKTLREAGEAPLDLSGPKVVVHPNQREGWERFFAGVTGPPPESGPRCPECGDPVDEPGRCFTCRGRSML